MKGPRLFQVTAPAADFAPFVAAARALGLRVGWLELAPPEPPPQLSAAMEAGCGKAVSLGPGGSVAAKRLSGPPVWKDVLREHFAGHAAVLVAGEGLALPAGTPRLEGADGRYRVAGEELTAEDLRKGRSPMKKLLLALLLVALPAQADWPQWRGPARDGIGPPLPAKLAPAPAKVWSLELGTGHSSPVMAGGRVVQHFRSGENEVVAAFELATGKELWRDAYPVTFVPAPEARDHGAGPFATPTIADGKVFTFGIQETVSAYDLASGKRLWRKEWRPEFAATAPVYGTSASPLVADGKVIVYVGGPGKGALVALDATTGAVLWRLDGEGPPYAPAVVATIGGVRQVVTLAQASLLGVDWQTGAKLWSRKYQVPWDNTILTPIVDGDRVILSAYDIDVQAFDIKKTAAGWTAEVAWSSRYPMYMSSPVLVGGRLYGFSVLKKGQLVALDAKTGKLLWASPGGLGEQAALIVAGNRLLALTEGAELHVLATGDSYQPLAKLTVADSATWAHPALLEGGRLLVKDARKLTLWQLAAP